MLSVTDYSQDLIHLSTSKLAINRNLLGFLLLNLEAIKTR